MELIITIVDENLLKRKGKNPSDYYLYQAQNASCFYCGLYMTPQQHGNKSKTKCDRSSGYTYDHLFPRSLGFSLRANKVLACNHCNQAKGSNMPTVAQIVKARKMYLQLKAPFIATVNLY